MFWSRDVQITWWRRPSVPLICKVDLWMHLWPWLDMLGFRLQRIKEGGGSRCSRSTDTDGQITANKRCVFVTVVCNLRLLMNENGNMDEAYSINTSIREILDGKRFLWLELDIHMLNAIWSCTTAILSVNHSLHGVGRTGSTFFQLCFLIGPRNSLGEVYNYLKVGAKDKKLLEILKAHLIIIIM